MRSCHHYKSINASRDDTDEIIERYRDKTSHRNVKSDIA